LRTAGKGGNFSVNLKLLGACALAAACALGGTAAAQSAAQAETATPAQDTQTAIPAATPAAAMCCKLAALTPVELEILTPASSRTSRQGEQIAIGVVEPVSVGGKVVVPAGTEGFAEVIQVSHGAFGGKPGELSLGMPYMTIAGQRIGLKRFRYGPSSGADRLAQSMVATAVIGISGMLISGGNIDIKTGTRANAVVTTDTFVPIQPKLSSKE
jgi:hypothetical protein